MSTLISKTVKDPVVATELDKCSETCPGECFFPYRKLKWVITFPVIRKNFQIIFIDICVGLLGTALYIYIYE